MSVIDTDATELEVLHEDDSVKVSLADVNVAKALGAVPAPGYSTAFMAGAGTDLLERPYDFDALYKRFENSSFLRPNVDAYVTNIDSFGHHFIPAIDLASNTAALRIRDSLIYERAIDADSDAAEFSEPSDEEVNATLDRLKRQARLEYMRLKAFYSYACPKSSLVALRRKLRQDLEVTGNGWFEVVRDRKGKPRRMHHLNALGMHLANPDAYPSYYEPVTVRVSVQHTDIVWKQEDEPQTFTLHVQLHDAGSPRSRTYYKEFGDPRIVSRDTGAVYPTLNDLLRAEPQGRPATEVIHMKVYSARSDYGIPRWAGTIPSVLGSIELDGVNYEYFDNNVIPPLALLVSGGRLGAEAAKRIEKIVEERIKGRKGINKMLIIEARGYKAAGEPGPVPAPKLQFVPLRNVQQTDALFQSYDVRNESKIAGSFRMPRIMRGIDTEINRATATMSFRLAEEQIFEPERETFDETQNKQILPALGIRFWQFRSNAPIIRDPEMLATMIASLTKVGVLVPAEGRSMLVDIFNRQFLDIEEEWTNKPLPIVLAQLGAQAIDTEYAIPAPDAPAAERPAAPPDAAATEAPVALLELSALKALGDDHE